MSKAAWARWCIDPWVRRKASFDAIDPDRHRVRVARTVEQYEEAFRLLYAGYVAEGAEPIERFELRMTEQHVLPECTVLVAYQDDRAVGTMSLTLDSPAGLPLDTDYPEAMGALRRGGGTLCEVGSFTIVRRYQRSGIAQLLSLAVARLAFGHGGADRMVIGVDPVAIPFFRAVWGFESFAKPRRHAELSVPTTGLVVERQHVYAHLVRHYPRPMATGYRPVEHAFEGPPVPGLELPPAHRTGSTVARWKMPRDAFQRLFQQRSNRLETLSEPTRTHLRRVRSDRTLGRLPLERHATSEGS